MVGRQGANELHLIDYSCLHFSLLLSTKFRANLCHWASLKILDYHPANTAGKGGESREKVDHRELSLGRKESELKSTQLQRKGSVTIYLHRHSTAQLKTFQCDVEGHPPEKS
jgi:hypothetical protein